MLDVYDKLNTTDLKIYYAAQWARLDDVKRLIDTGASPLAALYGAVSEFYLSTANSKDGGDCHSSSATCPQNYSTHNAEEFKTRRIQILCYIYDTSTDESWKSMLNATSKNPIYYYNPAE